MIHTIIHNVALMIPISGIMAQGSVNTAIGPISADPGSFISTVLKLAVGIGGVAAIGLIAAGGFTILTSTGDPEKLMNGREMITNALMGLALIVLSMFILEFLGWDILELDRWAGVQFNNWF